MTVVITDAFGSTIPSPGVVRWSRASRDAHTSGEGSSRLSERIVGRCLVAALVLAAVGCASPEQKAMKRSTDLVESLRQRSFPGLPPTLTPEQAMEIERARTGPGAWFVETGCFACHSVSVHGVKSYSQMGPDLSEAVEDVQKRFGRKIDDFWHEPSGTMTMVRMQLIKLSPDEEALGLQKLKAAFEEHQKAQKHGEHK